MSVVNTLIPVTAVARMAAAFASLLIAFSVPVSFAGEAGNLPVLVVKSPYDLEQTVANLKTAAEGNNFRVIREQSVDHGLVENEDEDRRQRILYFCNFDMLHDALAIDKRVGVFLPCQVNVTEREDGVYVIAPNPKVISALFLLDNPELAAACTHLQNTYEAILEEGTL